MLPITFHRWKLEAAKNHWNLLSSRIQTCTTVAFARNVFVCVGCTRSQLKHLVYSFPFDIQTRPSSTLRRHEWWWVHQEYTCKTVFLSGTFPIDDVK